MPFQKGNQLAKGRKPGKSQELMTIEQTAKRLGVNIFEILCQFAMGDWKSLGYDTEVRVAESGSGDGKQYKLNYTIPPELRLKAAETAAKYIYSQKRSIEIEPAKQTIDIDQEEKIESLMAEYRDLKELK